MNPLAKSPLLRFHRPFGIGALLWVVCAVSLACSLPWISSTSTSAAGPQASGSIYIGTGYDSEILADPERSGSVEPVDAGLANSTANLRLLWIGSGARNSRFDLQSAISASKFSGRGPSSDLEFRGAARYSGMVSRHTSLQLWTKGGTFRREEVPLFDVDHVGAGAALVRVNDGWLTAARTEHTWLSFPGRELLENPSQNESDRQIDLAVSLTRYLSPTSHAGIRLGLRAVRSNEARIEYTGPLVSLRGRSAGPGKFTTGAYAVYGRRSYPEYPVLQSSDGELFDVGKDRSDETWRFGLELLRPLSPRLRLEFEGSLTHQTSNVAALEFDQARFTVGIRVLPWSGRDEHPQATIPRMIAASPIESIPSRSGSEAGSVGPQSSGRGFRFSCRAPGATSVSLLGGFNRWAADRHPLVDPDGDGVWEITVSIPMGIWRYAFVVDGQWIRPEGAERYEDDGFGGINGILEVTEAR